MTDKSEKYHTVRKRARHYLFLNPYLDTAFTRCPKCEEKTKIRKYCLVIHIDPKCLLSLNKSCRYCPECDLIIVKQQEAIKRLFPFKDAWNFEVIPAGRYPKEQVKSRNRGTDKT